MSRDWEDNTDDEIMREHAEEQAMRVRFRWHHGEKTPVVTVSLPDPTRPVDLWPEEIMRVFAGPPVPQKWRCGWLFRWGSLWVGAHWAGHNKRLCINLIPCVTFWVTLPGGNPPR